MPKFDYLVLKPKPFDFGDGVERVMEIGSRIPGSVAETWGQDGRAVDHLVGQGVLAPVPLDEAANEGWDAGFGDAALADEPADDESAPSGESFPHHTGFGNYTLSDGSTVKGKGDALKAQAALDEAAQMPFQGANVGAGEAAFHAAAYKGISASGNVKTSASGVLHALDLHNLDATVAFLQVFDATSNAAVTLGTTVPNLSIAVPASGEKTEPDLEYGFNNGLVFAVTTTDGGLTAPATGLTVNATFSQYVAQPLRSTPIPGAVADVRAEMGFEGDLAGAHIRNGVVLARRDLNSKTNLLRRIASFVRAVR